jgi:hypothetical protein
LLITALLPSPPGRLRASGARRCHQGRGRSGTGPSDRGVCLGSFQFPALDAAAYPAQAKKQHGAADMNARRSSCSSWSVANNLLCRFFRNTRALDLKSVGHSRSVGAGTSKPSSTARHVASERRAHHRCSVDGCPCRIDFSFAECSLTLAMGKSTSMRRLQVMGIKICSAVCFYTILLFNLSSLAIQSLKWGHAR